MSLENKWVLMSDDPETDATNTEVVFSFSLKLNSVISCTLQPSPMVTGLQQRWQSYWGQLSGNYSSCLFKSAVPKLRHSHSSVKLGLYHANRKTSKTYILLGFFFFCFAIFAYMKYVKLAQSEIQTVPSYKIRQQLRNMNVLVQWINIKNS